MKQQQGVIVCVLKESAEEKKRRKKEWKHERRKTRNAVLEGRRQQRQDYVTAKDGRQGRLHKKKAGSNDRAV
jgi:hypothetical protein